MTRSRNPDRSIERPTRRPLPRSLWKIAPGLAMLAPLSPLLPPAVGVRPAAGQVQDRQAVLEQQRKQRAANLQNLKQHVETMQPLPAKTLDEVFKLKMQGHDLGVVSPLKDKDQDTNNTYRLKLDAFKGPTYVQVSNMGIVRIGVAGAPGPAAPRMLNLISYDLPNPDEFDTLSIQSFPGHLQIYRQSQVGVGGFRMIRLVQTRPSEVQPAAGAEGTSVQLFINEAGDAVPAGALPRNLTLQSPDFQSLVREHPREADEVIRPLLRQLGQESVLAPDDQIAWQVLSDRWKPDPELVRKVRQLLPAFNERDFHARDKALAAMQQMGKAGAAVLLHLDRSGLSPEQNLAIDRTLAPFGQLTAREAARLRDDTDFLLDCLYGKDREVRAAALDRLKEVTGKDLSFDLDAPEPDRGPAVSALRRELAARTPGTPGGTGGASRPTTEPAKS